jgi:predicted O-methyltransferase YrrM
LDEKAYEFVINNRNYMKRFLLCLTVVMVQLSSVAFSLEDTPFPLELKSKSSEVRSLLEKIEKVRGSSYGWCSQIKSEAIVALILNTKPQVCVEVGVFGGASFLPIALTLQYMKSGKAYAIDSWSNKDCIKYMENDDANRSWWSKVNLNSVYDSFKKNLKSENLKKFGIIYYEDAVEASTRFANNSIEFLHWDGNHSFTGAQRELQAYLPKVKSGGYILVSDVMWNVGDANPILEATDILFETCEIIDTLEDSNVFLFKKL